MGVRKLSGKTEWGSLPDLSNQSVGYINKLQFLTPDCPRSIQNPCETSMIYKIANCYNESLRINSHVYARSCVLTSHRGGPGSIPVQSSCICGEQCVTDEGFHPSTFVFPCQLSFHQQTILSSITRGCYSRPTCVPATEGLSLISSPQ